MTDQAIRMPVFDLRSILQLALPAHVDALVDGDWRPAWLIGRLHCGDGPIALGDFSEESGAAAMQRLLEFHPGLDAVFCGNDQIARGVADRLRETGLRVPEDVALVGFDNWAVIATACRPPLTTVDMNLRQLGRAAGERLLAAVDGHPGSGLQLLPCSLVVRESSRSRGS